MPEPLQEMDMEATIRSAYEGLQTPDVTPEVEAEVTPEVAPEAETEETPEQAAARARDERGRFVAKEESVEVTEEEIEAELAAMGEKPEEAKEPTPYDSAPTSWKKEAVEGWANIPETVRAEIHRREQNFLDGIQQYKGAAEYGNTIQKEIAPYEPLIRSLNTTAPEAIKYMLNNEYVLRTGNDQQKADLIAQAIKDYGVDPNKIRLNAGEPELPPELQQQISPVLQRVQQLEQELNQQRNQARQAQEAASRAQMDELAQEVERFKSTLDDSGKPKHPYYDLVREDMAALISNGRAQTLDDAYDKAVWANPEARTKLLSAQEAERKRVAARKAAEAKKAAAVNVSTQGTLPEKPTTGTMEDTIRETYQRLTGQS